MTCFFFHMSASLKSRATVPLGERWRGGGEGEGDGAQEAGVEDGGQGRGERQQRPRSQGGRGHAQQELFSEKLQVWTFLRCWSLLFQLRTEAFEDLETILWLNMFISTFIQNIHFLKFSFIFRVTNAVHSKEIDNFRTFDSELGTVQDHSERKKTRRRWHQFSTNDGNIQYTRLDLFHVMHGSYTVLVYCPDFFSFFVVYKYSTERIHEKAWFWIRILSKKKNCSF